MLLLRTLLSFLLLAFVSLFSLLADAQAAGGVQAGEPTFRVIRSVSGSKGSPQGGRFVMEDPRSTFYLSGDSKIIVYFDWEGPLGTHHFEGYWKNPEGKAVVISDFTFEAKQKRFGGYWELSLTDGTTPGMWALEAHVDGEVTGTHMFQIVAAPKPAIAGGNEPQALTPAQIYQKALDSTITIEKLGANGERLGKFSGFVINTDLVATTFEAIDGAVSVRLTLPKGAQQQVSSVMNWNRWQSWALLRVATGELPKLRRARPNSWHVGDRCFFLNVAQDGTRTIADVDITGTHKYPNAGERLQLSNVANLNASGSPLLNEYGDVIGLIGAGTVPGSGSLLTSRFGTYASSLRTRMMGMLALPINQIAEDAGTSEVQFSELAANGQFVPPLGKTDIVGQGALSLRMDLRPNVAPMPQDERYEFSRTDKQFAIFLLWTPKEKLSGQANFKIYDLNNRMLLTGKPAKLNVRANNVGYTGWQIGIESVPAGTYRLDAVVSEQPVWRTYFTVTD